MPDDAGVRRIVVTGSEGTGKTRLAHDLADWLHAPGVPEFARAYAESRGGVLGAADVEPIARGQIAAEDQAVAALLFAGTGTHARHLLLLDTDLVSTTVYAEHYYGVCPPWIMEAARERLGDMYLLCAIDVPWEADGVRDQPEARGVVQARFVARLAELAATVLPVSGHGPERLERAVAAVRGWRAAAGM